MHAVLFEEFRETPAFCQVPDPVPGSGSVVVEVKANGICRSDWHAWMGHDATVRLPHVPGHELAGVVVEVGSRIENFRVGDRVTVPFACGCGVCRYCKSGQLHVCDNDFQPGFTNWGAFAEFVEIQYADHNLVRLPDQLGFVEAASLGCRFSTAYRAVIQQAQPQKEDWLAIHGCGGLGLSAVMIGKAMGLRVVAVDIQNDRLALAREFGADVIVRASDALDVAEHIIEATWGGADVSLDALGSRQTATNSINCLRKQGCHVQVGLLLGDHANPALPMGRVISHELQIKGSHGMSATEYPELLRLVIEGGLDPGRLVSGRISLSEAPAALIAMGHFHALGVTVIDQFAR